MVIKEEKERLWLETPPVRTRPEMTSDQETSRARAAALGAVKLLKHWPNRRELLLAAFIGCLVSSALVGLALLPVIIGYQYDHVCWLQRQTLMQSDSNTVGNLYFVKHENRTWTNEELCNIETAAYTYPEFKVFIINLRSENATDVNKKWKGRLFDLTLDYYIPTIKKEVHIFEKENNLQIRKIPNIINIDVDIEQFFKGSILGKNNIKNSSRDKIELAAKFQAIWDSPGIALEPLSVHQLKTAHNLFKRIQNRFIAGVQFEHDLQVSTVACQSFIGLVIREIAKSDMPKRQTVLKHAILHFCLSLANCTGVQILPILEEQQNNKNCSTVTFNA